VEGTMVAMQNHLDVLGVLILSFATAAGGGIMRDVLIGATPPEALRHWLYPSIALGGGALAFIFVGIVQKLPNQPLIGLDAVGLWLFAVAGTEKALDGGLPSLVAICLGAITATGGGTMRDVLLARIPVILRTDVYATTCPGRRGCHGRHPKGGRPRLAVCADRRCGLLRPASDGCMAGLEPAPHNVRGLVTTLAPASHRS
jgi:uncharacterized membrane protein YeiH